MVSVDLEHAGFKHPVLFWIKKKKNKKGEKIFWNVFKQRR